jgi:hypothetical protein
MVVIIHPDITRDTLISPGTDNFSRVITTMNEDAIKRYVLKVREKIEKKKKVNNII